MNFRKPFSCISQVGLLSERQDVFYLRLKGGLDPDQERTIVALEKSGLPVVLSSLGTPLLLCNTSRPKG